MTTVAVTLEAPRWLWLLLPCWAAVWIVALAWPIDRGLSRVRWATAITRTVLLSGLIVTLARPIRFTPDAAVSAVVLLDVSASVPDGELARSRTLVDRLSRAAVPPHELRLVRFAAEPVEVELVTGGDGLKHATTALARPTGTAALNTDIARALGLAAGLGDPERTRRVLLISDGRATRGDAWGMAGRLAALGVRVDTIPLATAGAGDVAIDALSAPADIHPHETFPLEIRIATNEPARVTLTLMRDGHPVTDTENERLLTLTPGETTVVWKTRVDTTTTSVFVAEVRRADGADAHPENNRGILAIAPLVPPRVLVLATAAGDAAPLIQALRAQSIDVDIHARGHAADAAALARADLVVLVDLPRTALSDTTLARIEATVRDGGGLLVTGGPHSFGPGGWDGSKLESLLPVRLDLPGRRDEPTLALALVIDRSGSMSGTKMELTKEAARATAQMLPLDDQIAIVAFDSQATVIVPMQRAANRLRIATDIGRIQPTGGTNILAGLREGVDQLGRARAKAKHAILLSDGQSATEGIAELVDAAAGSRITISTVGVGDGVDEALLQLIAGHGGGRYYHARDPASIPRIFTREASEVAATGVVERPTTAVSRKHASMLDGVGLAGAPRLGGYVRTHVRPQADLLLSTDSGDPLLSRWSVGLGQVVAWTSDLGPRWAESWARWPPASKFWAQIARATMRARAAERFPLSAKFENGVATVNVEAVGPDDRFLSGLDGVLEITEVGSDGLLNPGLTRRIPLPESAPGRYEARFGVAAGAGAAPGALLLHATLTRDLRPVARADASLAQPFALELRPAVTSEITTNGPGLLAAIAARTGGGALASPEDLFRDVPQRRTSHPLRSPLLVATALLFILDVAIRRLTGARRNQTTAKAGRVRRS